VKKKRDENVIQKLRKGTKLPPAAIPVVVARTSIDKQQEQKQMEPLAHLTFHQSQCSHDVEYTK